ncbi:CDP-glycerol glycerophosphotransferase family protein [Campylobacter sp. JMF_04 NA10]|uniref:CDP-glycerol glycerophosphotransferase family protein n=1 Tax=Campylobacter sp. JMF_04 NA10 TaxID=2983824 RepID=UPI0022E9B4B1|nr:CDP-glycerol glycerophosphotransferase family protein [Campylobacter sp. JMF_04 NA10]MDA3075970.1 CDP-glycerol glycerophosphotransferase family protein [Campylobacter sp. JMF_04 NA10]
MFYVKLFINLILYLFAKITPKSEKIWLYGAVNGANFSDNSRYFFEYIRQNHPQIRSIWITKNDAVLQKLQNLGIECYKAYSPKAIYFGLRAGFFITSHVVDMAFMGNTATKIINLCHGVPLKKIGGDDIYDPSTHKSIKNWLITTFFPFTVVKNSLICASGEEDKKHFFSAFNFNYFNVKLDDIAITGYARNDILQSIKPKNSQINVLYMPTFRKAGSDEIDLFSDFKAVEFNKIFKEKNIKFIIKIHPFNRPNEQILNTLKNCENIEFALMIDAAQLLCKADILITDYSSCYIDFLLTNRALIFAPFDYERYIATSRELHYDYETVTPGAKCKNWQEVIAEILNLASGVDKFKNEREKVRDFFHRYNDTKACERVYQTIKDKFCNH